MSKLERIPWQLYVWVLGSLFEMGVRWVRFDIEGIEWHWLDAVAIALMWPYPLGIDIVRIADWFR